MAKVTVHGGASNAAADEAEAGEGVSAGAEASPSPEPGYEDWPVEQLKEQLGERGLSKTGKRDDLVQRLREDDAAHAAEPGAE